MNSSLPLSRITIFDCLSPNDIQELERDAQIEHLSPFPKKSLIQTPEKRRRGLYFVKEGKLRLYKLSAEGREFTLDILGPGNMFGELDMISLGTGNMFIETMENSALCLLPNERFERLLRERPQVAVRFIQEMGHVLLEREAFLTRLAIGNMIEQVLHVLIKLGKQFGTDEQGFHKIALKLTHQEIANMIGIRRETVTSILNRLAQRGIVKTRRQSIYVHVERAQNEMGRMLLEEFGQKAQL